jgi:hypothetical protein
MNPYEDATEPVAIEDVIATLGEGARSAIDDYAARKGYEATYGTVLVPATHLTPNAARAVADAVRRTRLGKG